MLVELNLVEQRYKAVLEVLDGASVTDVALRNGVLEADRPRLAAQLCEPGPGLARGQRSKKPERCPHQMAPQTEAKVLELRRAHPGWGPRTILGRLRDAGRRAVAVALCDLSRARAAPAIEPEEAQATALGLQALGADPVHGALADGRHGPLLLGRRHRVQGRHRRRRPLEVLRLRQGRGPGDREARVRRLARGPAQTRRTRAAARATTARSSPRDSASDLGRCCSTGSVTTTGSSTS